MGANFNASGHCSRVSGADRWHRTDNHQGHYGQCMHRVPRKSKANPSIKASHAHQTCHASPGQTPLNVFGDTFERGVRSTVHGAMHREPKQDVVRRDRGAHGHGERAWSLMRILNVVFIGFLLAWVRGAKALAPPVSHVNGFDANGCGLTLMEFHLLDQGGGRTPQTVMTLYARRAQDIADGIKAIRDCMDFKGSISRSDPDHSSVHSRTEEADQVHLHLLLGERHRVEGHAASKTFRFGKCLVAWLARMCNVRNPNDQWAVNVAADAVSDAIEDRMQRCEV